MPIYPPWHNQDLQLYHGTTMEHAETIRRLGVDVFLSRPNCEFGKGFYCTTLQDQAALWAKKKAKRQKKLPALVKLVVPRSLLAELATLSFVVGGTHEEDFWSFVHFCRLGGVGHGRTGRSSFFYDVVFGPVTYWPQIAPMEHSDQISFHTISAQNLLNRTGNRSIILL